MTHDEQARELINNLDAIARAYDSYEFGLPTNDDESIKAMFAVTAAALAQAAQPVWTTEKPTVEGWYWWRGESDLNELICWVGRDGGVLFIAFAPSTTRIMGGEWAGPLPLPMEANRLPTIEEMGGSDPGFTSGLSTKEYLDELRDK